jgi:hypothetical protein
MKDYMKEGRTIWRKERRTSYVYVYI